MVQERKQKYKKIVNPKQQPHWASFNTQQINSIEHENYC